MPPSFIHLRVHTEYSLSDGLLRIPELIAAAVRMNMPAIAVTDQSNLFAAIKFYQAAISAGIKPIIGADCWLEDLEEKPSQITFLCQNDTGYKHLIQLISRSYLEGQKTGKPVLKREWLKTTNEGLIALSGGRQGDIGRALLEDKFDIAASLLEEYSLLFPDRFYLELQRTGRFQEETYLLQAVQLAYTYNMPVIATQEVCFLHEADFEAHEARVCIHHAHMLYDKKRPQWYSKQQYLRSPEEMQSLFADIPSALINTVELAKRCNLELALNQIFLPAFPIPKGMTAEHYLSHEVDQGLKQRLALKTDNNHSLYFDRLQLELDVINSMGFAGYFLIVTDFIRWAKENNIPVGPGRGSGAGSLVAYALQITDIDPLQYDLLFERFLNPERVSMPDFDIDFCMEGRDRVIEYVTKRYGHQAVSQIITYGKMSAKAVLRDVGRVLGYPYGMVDKLAKLVPFKLGITLKEALTQDELKYRYEQEEEVTVLINLALKLEGLVRNVGKHAGGVVIAPSKLINFTPLYCEPGKNEHCITQYDKDDIEKVGLVKFDFLGLRTLTIINWAAQMINSKYQTANQPKLDMTQLSLKDEKTFFLLKTCKTTAVFQFESRGMKDLIRRMQPDNFEDLIALLALFRPGPLQSGMVDDFINRKQGRSKVNYPHPALEPILRTTYGIIVYQEQVLQIAQKLAGYTLGAADLLRRAMGKKKTGEMAKQRVIFIAGAKQRGVSSEVARSIFDLMEKFADYGFNKSHAAAYALISYQTAWLKAHYPAEFMAAVLSSDMDDTEKVVSFLAECRVMQLKVLSPDINDSEYKFRVNKNNDIVYGLGAIKGLGEAIVEWIIEVRQQGGFFKDFFDFCHRIDVRKINRRALEALIHAGSFDRLNAMHRASLITYLDDVLQTVEQTLRMSDQGQYDLFGMTEKNKMIATIEATPELAEELLQKEKGVLGFYLSSHPLQQYEEELQQFVTASLAQIERHQSKSVTIAGWVIAVRTLLAKRGTTMSIVVLEDQQGTRLELTVFNDTYVNYRQLLTKERLLIVEGEVTVDNYSQHHKLLAKHILTMTQAREKYARHLLFRINANDSDVFSFIEPLKKLLLSHGGGACAVVVEYKHLNIQARLALSSTWRVRPDDELLTGMKKILGEAAVALEYS